MQPSAVLYSVRNILIGVIIGIYCSASLAHGATLVVRNNNDVGSGSFRQAITDNQGLGGGNTIIFSNIVTGTITLLGGELVISTNVTIIGPGPGTLAINGHGTGRVFNLAGNGTVNISGLTITGASGSFASSGGGIYQQAGTLNLTDCIVSQNYIDHGNGAGIYAGGTLVANRCTISGNGCYVGGGIYVAGTATLINCTVAGNGAAIGAGGIFGGGPLVLSSCTISANTSGSGLYQGAGINSVNTTIRNTIVAGNTNGWGYPDCYGAFTSQGYNLIGTANGTTGFNGVGDQTGNTNAPLPAKLLPLGNYTGLTPTMPPQTDSLAIDQGNSGSVTTDQRGRPRGFDNPAIINATLGDGSDIGAVELGPIVVNTTNDVMTGSLRQGISIASAGDSTITFASNVVGTITLTNGDLAIGKDLTIIGPGARTLAINANTNSPIFTVLSGNVSISGLTLANGRGVGTDGGFEQNGAEARGGGIFNQATLALTDCILSNNVVRGGAGGSTDIGIAGGGGNGLGGAIANIGTLNLTNCYLVANAAQGGSGGVATSGGFEGNGGQGYGGALYSFGPLTLVRCGLAQNVAAGGSGGGGDGSGSGGGIYNEANVTLLTCTIASNSATGTAFDFGGGIYDNGSAVTIRGSTIAGNQADFGGGVSLSAAAVCSDTILAYNVAGSGPDCSGTINSGDYNLIQDISGATITGTTNHNLTGQNPLLGAMADNGGLSATMAPLAGSPVLDKGKNFGLTTDQRGAPRPFDFAAIANAAGGDGSDIGAFELGSPTLNIQKFATNVVLSWQSYYGDFTLQSLTDLSLANSWAPVGNAPTVSGNQYLLTNSPITGNIFYRLKGN